MAINEILYTVSALGIIPDTKQNCGVQGDHNLYALKFQVEASLFSALNKKKENSGGELFYRFDLYNGEGAKTETMPQRLSEEEIYFNVPNWLTRFGGVGKVVLVITLCEDNLTHLELYSFPSVLQFKNRPLGEETDMGEDSLATLAQTVKTAAAEVLKARDEVIEAENYTKEVDSAIKSGMNILLEGKRAGGMADVFDVITAELSSSSQNPVSSAVIYKALEKINEKITNVSNTAIKEALLLAHPVGSLYWSESPINPETLFGGKWQAVTNTFIIAAGEEFPAGSEGGSKTATLTVSNLPKHSHTGLYYSGSTFVGLTGTSASKEGYAVTGSNELKVYTQGLETGETGGGNEFSVMPPYKAFYCWLRTE